MDTPTYTVAHEQLVRLFQMAEQLPYVSAVPILQTLQQISQQRIEPTPAEPESSE